VLDEQRGDDLVAGLQLLDDSQQIGGRGPGTASTALR
jgi:hypothetical protein